MGQTNEVNAHQKNKIPGGNIPLEIDPKLEDQICNHHNHNSNNSIPIVGNPSSNGSQIYSGSNTSSDGRTGTIIGRNFDDIKKEVSTFLSQSLLRRNGKYPRQMSAYVKFEEEKYRQREELKRQIENDQGIELDESNEIPPNDFLNQILQQQFSSENQSKYSNIPGFEGQNGQMENLYNRMLFHKTYSIVTDTPNRANSLNSINNNNSNQSQTVRSKDRNSSMFSSKIHTNQHSVSHIGFGSSRQNTYFESPQQIQTGFTQKNDEININYSCIHNNNPNSFDRNTNKNLTGKPTYSRISSLPKQTPGIATQSTFKTFRHKKISQTSSNLRESIGDQDNLNDGTLKQGNRGISTIPGALEFCQENQNVISNTNQQGINKVIPQMNQIVGSDYVNTENDLYESMADERCSQIAKKHFARQISSECGQLSHINDASTDQNTFPEMTECEIDNTKESYIRGQQIKYFDNHTSSNYAVFNQSPSNKYPNLLRNRVNNFNNNVNKDELLIDNNRKCMIVAQQIEVTEENKEQKDEINENLDEIDGQVEYQNQQGQNYCEDQCSEMQLDVSEFQERGKLTERKHDLRNYQFNVVETPTAKGRHNNNKNNNKQSYYISTFKEFK